LLIALKFGVNVHVLQNMNIYTGIKSCMNIYELKGLTWNMLIAKGEGVGADNWSLSLHIIILKRNIVKKRF